MKTPDESNDSPTANAVPIAGPVIPTSLLPPAPAYGVSKIFQLLLPQ